MRPAPRATMRDVAALAGVSVKTVSRVVNQEPSVSPDVAQRVRTAVATLGYRHHLGASTLRRTEQRTGTVAALLQDLSNAYSASVLRAIEVAAHERDIAVVASSLDEDPARERQIVEGLVRRRVDGLVLMPATASQAYLQPDLDAGLVTVCVDRHPQGISVDSVAVDGARGGALATTHLLDHGHRRVAFLGDDLRIETAAARYAGYERALAAREVALEPGLVVTGLRSAADAARAVHGLLDSTDPPTAIFAARNAVAEGAVRTLRERGVAHATALVGFDDFALADVLDPPLTVVRQDVDAIGAEVVSRLFARLDGDTSPPRAVDIDLELVRRGSGEIRPPH
ncbi:LacI family DNA-binding transcriptional regulator [Knoellia sp. DB2414S]|uniref:LacI family DNA-binding transcriptional regulator n=2 Tax=Knoellia koreensis TaxID=2730921 RepID=A0A849HJ35_9MICO|nr:LacI family DNA-binding transcriptional regulator [Knoellia sp. DB2414S]